MTEEQKEFAEWYAQFFKVGQRVKYRTSAYGNTVETHSFGQIVAIESQAMVKIRVGGCRDLEKSKPFVSWREIDGGDKIMNPVMPMKSKRSITPQSLRAAREIFYFLLTQLKSQETAKIPNSIVRHVYSLLA